MSNRVRLIYNYFLYIYISSIAVMYSFEAFWCDKYKKLYAVSAGIGIIILISLIFKYKIYKFYETWLIVLYGLFIIVSIAYNYGLSLRVIGNRMICILTVVYSLYYINRCSQDSKKMIDCYVIASITALTVENVFILIHATISLTTQTIGKDSIKGCFQRGRLCGIGNANVLGTCCLVLTVFSVYIFIESTKKIVKIIWIMTGIVGWINLGITSSRTSIIGVAFSFGLLVFRFICQGSIWKKLLGILAGLCVMAITIGTLMVQPQIYRTVIKAYAKATNNIYLSENIELINSRSLTQDDGTLTDRTLIWNHTIKSIMENKRLLIWGTTYTSEEQISGIYEGHHEITLPHAHNTYIELLRKSGIPGFILCMILVMCFFVNGVKIFFDYKEEKSNIYLMTIAASIVLIGLTEQVPIISNNACFAGVGISFFSICGFVMNKRGKAC